MTNLPKIHETTFGGFVASIYGYTKPDEAAGCGDSDVAEMIEWTMRDPKGPQIGWDERIYYWENIDEHEEIWRHRPEIGDLDAHGSITKDAIARRGV